jgi:hypothetical protein
VKLEGLDRFAGGVDGNDVSHRRNRGGACHNGDRNEGDKPLQADGSDLYR